MANPSHSVQELAEKVRRGIQASPSGAAGHDALREGFAALRSLEEQLQAAQDSEVGWGYATRVIEEENTRLKEQYQTALDRLWEAHDQLCGCDKPADAGRCSAPEETWGAFEYLGERDV